MSKNSANKADVVLATSWTFPHVGGVSSHMSLLADQLGIQLKDVVSPNNVQATGNRLVNGLKRAICKILKRETVTMYSQPLVKVFEGAQCDVVHCHDIMATWVAVKARKASGQKFKIVATLHGPVSNTMIEEGASPNSPDVAMVRKCEHETWQECDALIAVDTTQAEIAVGQGADRNKIVIIRNAVDLVQIDLLSKSLALSKEADQKWILVPRRLAPKNGIEFAIKALSFMDVKPKLLIAGTGNEKENLERLVAELGLKDNVVFLGGLGHSVLIPLMALSDIVVIPSVPVHGIVEATSISAIEAMALSRPVVASNIGGLKELITSGVNGMLVPPNDPQQLADVFTLLLGDTEQAAEFGRQARNTVIDHFNVDLWFERHQAVYSKVLGP